MDVLVALPNVLPLFAGALSLVFWRSHPVQRMLGVFGSLALLVVSVLLLFATWEHG
ncbi:MAG TPA: Na+/H+ antiporter subunit D, partial [Thioalkalivibrio sp.]|nr:Na+/H+ antiporter subunit D [Thioalkalivibrio sp.]